MPVFSNSHSSSTNSVSAGVFKGCPFIELLSPQGSKPLDNWQVVTGSQQYYLLPSTTTTNTNSNSNKKRKPSTSSATATGNVKVYERDLKGFCFVCSGSTRLQLPSVSFASTLKSISTSEHPYLVIQAFIPAGQNFSIELGVLDGTLSNRRIVISSAVKSFKTTPMHTQIPLCAIISDDNSTMFFNNWLSLVVDLNSILLASFKQTFSMMHSLSVGGPSSKFRKIFLAKSKPPPTHSPQQIPSTLQRSSEVFSRSLDLPDYLNPQLVFVDMDAQIDRKSTRHLEEELDKSKSSPAPPRNKPVVYQRLKLTRPKSDVSSDHVQILHQKRQDTASTTNSDDPVPSRIPSRLKARPLSSNRIRETPSSSVHSKSIIPKKKTASVPKIVKESVVIEDEDIDELFQLQLEDTSNNIAAVEQVETANDEDMLEIQQWIKGSGDLMVSTAKLLDNLKLQVKEVTEEDDNDISFTEIDDFKSTQDRSSSRIGGTFEEA